MSAPPPVATGHAGPKPQVMLWLLAAVALTVHAESAAPERVAPEEARIDLGLAFWEGPGLPPDADEDGVHDVLDNCPITMNPGQPDLDADGFGDACDPDLDIVAGVSDFRWIERLLGGATLTGAVLLLSAFSRVVRQIRVPRRA